MTFEDALLIKEQIAVGWWHTFCCNCDAEPIKDDTDLHSVLEDMDPDLMFGCHPEHLWRSEAEMKADPIYQQWLKDDPPPT
jgi:hypothetical protein